MGDLGGSEVIRESLREEAMRRLRVIHRIGKEMRQ